MLGTRVTTNSQIGVGGVWTDPNANPAAPIATSCHFATVYWVFWEEFGHAPSQADIVRMGSAQGVVSRMLPHAARKNNPLAGHLTLTTGSVLVFAHNNIAEHSCTAIAPQSVGGYNQMGWYSAGGANHGYSSHPTSQLIWGNLNNRSHARRVQAPGWYQLYEVPEGVAKAVVRSAAQ
jgi:hypothetical protein